MILLFFILEQILCGLHTIVVYFTLQPKIKLQVGPMLCSRPLGLMQKRFLRQMLTKTVKMPRKLAELCRKQKGLLFSRIGHG